jgi:hypothetical protein
MNLKLLNPRLLVFLVISISTLIWAFYKPLFSYEKYISLNAILNYCLFFILILTAAFIMEKIRFSSKKEITLQRFQYEKTGQSQVIYKEAMILASIAMIAQLLWIARMIALKGVGPLFQLVILNHDFETFKLTVVNKTTMSGVTTLTQLGILASGMYALYVFGLKNKGRFLIWLFILFPGVLRGMFFSERLALMEGVIPVLVMAVLFQKVRLTFTKIILGTLSFVIFFSMAEGLRSYSYYAKTGVAQGGIYAYGFSRFADYISSSVNHSMAMVDLANRIVGFPQLLFSSILSVIDRGANSSIGTMLGSKEGAQAYLNVKNSIYSAPDYTNMGFFGSVFQDAGYLYIFYAILYGTIIGLAYKGLRNYEFSWIVVYPIIFISVLESYRIPYLFDVRAFYPLLYMLIRYFVLSYQKQKQKQMQPRPSPFLQKAPARARSGHGLVRRVP